MNELMTIQARAIAEAQEAAAQELRAMREALATMAAMLQATTESMAELRRQVRLLEKVTPAQAADVNRAARERAREICGIYGAAGGEKAAAAAIRKDVRARFGAGAMRDIPRCDYPVALEAARKWDDYRAMTAIRKKARE